MIFLRCWGAFWFSFAAIRSSNASGYGGMRHSSVLVQRKAACAVRPLTMPDSMPCCPLAEIFSPMSGRARLRGYRRPASGNSAARALLETVAAPTAINNGLVDRLLRTGFPKTYQSPRAASGWPEQRHHDSALEHVRGQARLSMIWPESRRLLHCRRRASEASPCAEFCWHGPEARYALSGVIAVFTVAGRTRA